MKVHFGRYREHWISPYKLLEKIVFWKDWEKYHAEHEDDVWWVEKATDILGPLCRGYNSVMGTLFPRKIKVRIDPWDTWGMYNDLALIILPMLIQLQKTKHGAPYVDDADVPDDLKSTAAPPKENEWDTDDNHFKRWDWILAEMIWAFDSIVNEDKYEDTFWIQRGEGMHSEKREDGNYEIKWGIEPKLDREKRDAHYARQENGLKLFGKYYRGLWD